MAGRLLSLDCIICSFTYLGSNRNPLAAMNKRLILTLSRYFSARLSDSGIQLMPLTRVRGKASLRHHPLSLCLRLWQLSVKGGVSPRVLSAACEVLLSVGPLSCRSLTAPPPTEAVSESDCPSLESRWTPLAPVYLTVYRPGSAISNKLIHTYKMLQLCSWQILIHTNYI